MDETEARREEPTGTAERPDRSGPTERYGRDARVATRGGEAGESPAFRDPHPRTYGRPDRDRLKRAFWAYVQGHDRGWEAERKRRTADATLEAEQRERRRRRALQGTPDEAAGGPTPAGLAPVADDRPPAGLGAARFGVPVPERLDFHRGPDTWRERIDRTRRAGTPPPRRTEDPRRAEEA